MKNRTLLLMLFVLVFLPKSPARAQLPPTADAYVNETNSTNYGTTNSLIVSNPNYEAFIQFDLSGLPSGTTGASVGKATLVLYASAVTTAGSYDVYEVGAPWSELTISGTKEPALGTLVTPGVPVTLATKNNFVVIDVTPAVKDWLNGTVANNGLALQPNGSAVNVTFNSKENGAASHAPQLNISLVEPPGDITEITAGAGLTGGGTSGNVTLGVDSTQVPFLNFSNTFTANQTVNGIVTASSFTGSGAGLTGVALLGAANTFTGSETINGNVSASSGSGTALSGNSTAATGVTVGVTGTTNSTTDGATGVLGGANASSGGTIGVSGYNNSTSYGAIGVQGAATASTGVNNGVFGYTNSTTDGADGVLGAALASTGAVLGVRGTTNSTSNGAAGVLGVANATSGNVPGVYGTSASSTGAGVYGSGSNGVLGISSSSTGSGVYGLNSATTGNAYGVYGTSASPSGYAGYFAGNVNATGTLTASSFTGNGAGVTNVNAALLNGLLSSAFQPAGSYAVTTGPNTFTGDQTLNAALNLAQTTGADVGVINMGGNPLIHACCPNSTGNTFVGTGAGNFTADDSGSGKFGENTAMGFQALQALTSGFQNTAGGYQALYSNTSGDSNTANGYLALYWNTTGNFNIASGYLAGDRLVSGNSNIMVGNEAGYNFTSNESYNIDIGNSGVAAESGVIRIGTGQTETFIAGITGVTPGGVSPLPVIIDGYGQLGTGTSALGTVTNVGSGAGLTGGPVTTSGTLSIATGGVTNAMLQNSSLTVSAGSGLTGGGSVSLGGSTTLNLNPIISASTGTFSGNNSSQIVSVTQNGTGTALLATAGRTGLYGIGNLYGVYGESGSSAGTGVYGLNYGNSASGQLGTSVSGNATGVYGSGLNGVYGSGTLYGVYGTSASSGGAGVAGNNTATSGNAYGVYGTSASSTGSGVYGNNTALAGDVMGVWGSSGYIGVLGGGQFGVYGSGYSYGVYGISSDYGIGVHGQGPQGVVGQANNAAYADGVTGFSGTGTGSLAGNFSGDVTVVGTLSATHKNFLIDHPLDPANRYLYHSSVESSEMMNIYTGNIVLDAGGKAVVQLPDWFESLNTDFRYQLTAVGAPGPNLYIAQEVQGNSFRIAGGSPGMKVSWQVTGVRQDAYAKAHPMQVEVDKPESERGYYIHPELYGAPEEKGIEWARHPEMMKRMKEQRAKPPEPPGDGAR